jgi:hypothetical protein
MGMKGEQWGGGRNGWGATEKEHVEGRTHSWDGRKDGMGRRKFRSGRRGRTRGRTGVIGRWIDA